MFKLKLFTSPLLVTLVMFFSASFVFAGGGPVEFSIEPGTSLSPGEQYIVHARVYADGTYPTYCKNCYIKLALQNPQEGDYIAQDSERTNEDGRIYAKVISKVSGTRTIYVSELIDNNGVKITANSTVNLSYKESSNNAPTPKAPEMIYPQNGQTLDLEGAYMFKVTKVEGASGYLFGLFQNGEMIYENYRDAKTLSSNGEFALWESNPAHAKFKIGEVKVMIRALVNNKWTDAREITIILKPREKNDGAPVTNPQPIVKQVPTIVPKATPSITPNPTSSVPGVISPTVKIIAVQDSSASAELEQKIEDLQNQLTESQQKQSALQSRLDNLIDWLKSVFPFFN